MKKFISHFLFSTEGVTSLEYALMASIIVVAIVLTVAALGANVSNLFQTVSVSYP